MMLNIFSGAYWTFVYLLWRTIYSSPLAIKKIGSFFIYSGYDALSPILWVIFSLSSWHCLQHESFKFWWKANVFIFTFVTCASGVGLRLRT